MFYTDKINNKLILKSTLLKDINAFFTTKESYLTTKEPSNIQETINNKIDICKYLNIDKENLINPIQTHSDNIEIVDSNTTIYDNTDGLILTKKDIGIFLNFADCTPIIIYDSENKIGAIAHAGWRGTAKKIGVKTIAKMVKECNSKINNITVLIGPSISACCYDVNIDVLEQLTQTILNSEKTYTIKNNKYYVNLKEINKRQFKEFGINRIDVCPYCTICNNNLFFSYRKENKTTNRHNAILSL